MRTASTTVVLCGMVLVGTTATLLTLVSLEPTVPTALRTGTWLLVVSVALGFAARRRPQRAVLAVVFATGLLIGANWSTVEDVNAAAAHHVSAGPERPTLEELADDSPSVSISQEIAMLFDLGAALDGGLLVVPDRAIAGRIRAFTAVEAIFGDTPSGLRLEGDRRRLGYLQERPVVLVGTGEAYVWIDSNPEAVFILGVDHEVLRDAG